ncbi:MAG TPA: hypothetical protein VE175_14240 [Woeseiaceae bacterium]|nr:hypothetical protein [Woeseiaceae bacterium]
MNKKPMGIIGAAFMLACLQAQAEGAIKEMQDVIGQGPDGPVVSEDGAMLIRTANGITATLTMPTPAPGTYPYPEGNVFQPTVTMGFPEVFTGWIFIFNDPAACDGPCDGGDLSNPLARGGVYNLAGHTVGGSTLNFAGHIEIGESTFLGFPLDDPEHADVHLAVAPHGMLQPDLLPTQITTPIGTPDYWWLALFIH